MSAISCYVDLGATLCNLSQKKGTHQYANDKEMTNSLKSILAGSIRCGDRLHAAGLIDTDKCSHPECAAKRHTTHHVFCECLRYKKRRDKCDKEIEKILFYAHQHVGAIAVDNLNAVLNNSTFRITGICPDDLMALATDTKKRDVEAVRETTPEYKKTINYLTEDLVYEEHDGKFYATAYTDGSLLDPNVDNFQRAGWGFYVGPGHPANESKPLETSNPSVFRAELRAIMHAIQVCAIPTMVRTDCKAAFLLVERIQSGKGYDVKHPEADILSVIARTNNVNCHIKWMPAHLDEEINAAKRDKYFKSGGTQEHINGNCEADALAKAGANAIPIDKMRHTMYALRSWITKTQQNFLYDVWHSEKERMYAADIRDPLAQQEIQNISDIEGMQQDDEEFNDNNADYEDNFHDFSNVDFDGNELGAVCPDVSRVSDNEAIFLASIKEAYRSIVTTTENVFNFVGAPPPSSPSSVVPSFSDNKNGLLHLSYTINKDICKTFTACKVLNGKVPFVFPRNSENKRAQCANQVITPQDTSAENNTHNGSLSYFLHNKDFSNVMHELYTSSLSSVCISTEVTAEKRETVSDFLGVRPLAAPVLLAGAPVCNNKNDLHSVVPTIEDSDKTISAYLDHAFPKYFNTLVDEDTFEKSDSTFLNYDTFPTFKTSYRNMQNVDIKYNSLRQDWEPYNWFFSQIQWTKTDSEHDCTYCELAIAAHILTGGATTNAQDLCTKTNSMTLAFKRYHQKLKFGELTFKEFFKPSANIRTLVNLGSDHMPGIKRTPYFACAPNIFKDVRLIVWKAVQHWQTTHRISRFGEAFSIKSRRESAWIPDSVIWLYKTIDDNKRKKREALLADSTISASCPNNDSSVTTVSPASPGLCALVLNEKNAHTNDLPSSTSAAANIVCFYGHKVSSAFDSRGREQWRFSPNPPWPGVPPARPLCQKCYLFHYTASTKGKSQYDFAQLYAIKQDKVSTARPPDYGGASSSTSITRPPD